MSDSFPCRLLSPYAALLLALLAGGTNATDWPLYGQNLANHRYSALSAINTHNVARLERAWSVNTGRRASFQATPIVIDGVMYVTLPFNDLLALDAASGAEIWRYRHQLRQTKTCCGPANRGATVAHGKVYFVTIDARFIALDQATGEPLWDRPITDITADARERLHPLQGERELAGAKVVGGTGYSANMAPQVQGDTVYVGITGAGYGLHLDVDQQGRSTLSVVGLAGGKHGLRGFLIAYDAHTGDERWRWYSVSGPDWVGDWRPDTPDAVPLNRDLDAERERHTRHADAWTRGGGSIWTTPAIDAELGLLYVGTGNPAPQMDDSTRPGDNRDTVSIVAIDTATGRKRWSYQQVPHDRWGYDVASPPVLFEWRRDGRAVPALAQAGKTGWIYVLDRRDGSLLFKSEPFVPQQNLFQPPTADGVRIAPGIYGGASWSPMAYHPGLNLFYVVGIHHPTTYFQKPLTPGPGSPWESYTFTRMDPDERWGTITAVSASDGSISWQQQTALPMVGGVLATAGNLLFTGEGQGEFKAFDAGNGELLWTDRTAAGVNAPPVTYEIDGMQYVAVAAGGNRLFRFTTGDEILVYKLPSSPR